jgi:hypothetical protein
MFRVCQLGQRNIIVLLGQLSSKLPIEISEDRAVLEAVNSFYQDCLQHPTLKNISILIAKQTPSKIPGERPIFVFIIFHDGFSFLMPQELFELFQKPFQEAGKSHGLESLLDNFTKENLDTVKSSFPFMKIANLRKQFSIINKIFPISEKNSKCEYIITTHTPESEIDFKINPETGFWEFPVETAPKTEANKLINIINGK